MANKKTDRGGSDIRKRGGDPGEHLIGGERVGDRLLHNDDPIPSDREAGTDPSVLQDDVYGADPGEETVGGSVLLPEGGRRTEHADQHSDESGIIPLQDSEPEPRRADDGGHEGRISEIIIREGSRDTEIKVPIPSSSVELDIVTFKFAHPTTERVVIVAGNSYHREFLAKDLPFQEKLVDYDIYLASTGQFQIISADKVPYERN